MNIDDYIEELKSKLTHPELYEFDGTYFYQGKDNTQYGKIWIDKKHNLAGEIKDPNSVCPKHAIEGKIEFKDKSILLYFKKIPTGLLANIYYRLWKENNGNIIGSYGGIWNLDAQEIFYSSNSKTAEIAGLTYYPQSVRKASLNLHKK